MSVNLSLAPPPSPLNSSQASFYLRCQSCVASVVVAAVYTLCHFLFLFPLAVLVLGLGFRRWRRGRGSLPHGDVLACHSVSLDVLGALGGGFYCAGDFLASEAALMVAVYVFCPVLPGHTALQCLACAEHYLAVVRPLTYRRLGRGAGLWARRAGLAGTWLLCAGWTGVTARALPEFPVASTLGLLGAALLLVCFFFLSVLRVLREGGGAGEGAGRSRGRALRAISLLVAALSLRFVALLVSVGAHQVEWAEPCVACVLMDVANFLSVPGSLALPALFLLRARTRR